MTFTTLQISELMTFKAVDKTVEATKPLHDFLIKLTQKVDLSLPGIKILNFPYRMLSCSQF